ncbi:MAG: hypothetical protein KKA84_08280 [Bacteroidetes bacterium]|nr:hypothetical protein [Bacteroidota bacterium]
MKVKVRFNTDDYLILGLLSIGAAIAFFGLYVAGTKFMQWLTSALSNVDMSL